MTQVKLIWTPNPLGGDKCVLFYATKFVAIFCDATTYNYYTSAKHFFFFFMKKVDSSAEIVGEESIL